MAVYTHLNEEQLSALALRYGLGELMSATGIAEGVENTNFLLQAAERKAILTVFEKRVKADELPFFMGLMQHLAHRGVPCPEPLQTQDGDMLSEVQGKPVAAVSFLEGQSRHAPSLADCAALGEAAAKLHIAAQDFTDSRANDLSLAGWRLLYVTIADELNHISAGLKTLIADELEYLSQHWPDDLPRGIIHADLFPNNVFFDDRGSLSGIIDFYFACEDTLAYELAICVNCWCFDKTVFNADKAAAMIEAYSSVRPLSEAERAALPTLARGAALRFLLTRAHDVIHHDDNAVVTPHDPLEYLDKLTFWQNYKGAL